MVVAFILWRNASNILEFLWSILVSVNLHTYVYVFCRCRLVCAPWDLWSPIAHETWLLLLIVSRCQKCSLATRCMELSINAGFPQWLLPQMVIFCGASWNFWNCRGRTSRLHFQLAAITKGSSHLFFRWETRWSKRSPRGKLDTFNLFVASPCIADWNGQVYTNIQGRFHDSKLITSRILPWAGRLLRHSE